jgi:nitrogen fixation/metabolism regulation signal transduction histidine kinase
VRELETLGEALDRMRGDLRAYRERLVTSERQAAWGQMARTVAHEVANPLTPIAVSIADLRRSYDQRHPDFPRILDQAVRTIAEEVETLRRMLQEFADLGRMPPPALAPVGVAMLFADLEALYGGEVAAGRLAFGRPGEDLCVAADAGQLRRALVNLIKNGLESLDAAGQVKVSASVEGGEVVIAIADSGRGLTVEQRVQLFTPGLTTKPHGSGLGLTIVQRIVHEHGGRIAVESAPGAGTTFRVHLPLAPEV